MILAFLSYPYTKNTEKFVRQIQPFIEQNDVKILDGKLPDAGKGLSDEIMDLISESDFLICIYSEDESSRWVDQEIGVAKGQEKDVIIITDTKKGNAGFVDHQYHISRELGDIAVCTALKYAIDGVKKRKSLTPEPPRSRQAPEDEIIEEKWPSDVLKHIYSLRGKFRELNYSGIIVEADEAVKSHPECWRYNIAKSSALIHLGELEKAEKELSLLINQFSDVRRALSYAYINLGWAANRKPNSNKDGLSRELSFYKRSLENEPRESAYINAIKSLVELEQFNEAEKLFGGFIRDFPDLISTLEAELEKAGLFEQGKMPQALKNILKQEDDDDE